MSARTLLEKNFAHLQEVVERPYISEEEYFRLKELFIQDAVFEHNVYLYNYTKGSCFIINALERNEIEKYVKYEVDYSNRISMKSKEYVYRTNEEKNKLKELKLDLKFVERQSAKYTKISNEIKKRTEELAFLVKKTIYFSNEWKNIERLRIKNQKLLSENNTLRSEILKKYYPYTQEQEHWLIQILHNLNIPNTADVQIHNLRKKYKDVATQIISLPLLEFSENFEYMKSSSFVSFLDILSNFPSLKEQYECKVTEAGKLMSGGYTPHAIKSLQGIRWNIYREFLDKLMYVAKGVLSEAKKVF
jgi:hypothetical protein